MALLSLFTPNLLDLSSANVPHEYLSPDHQQGLCFQDKWLQVTVSKNTTLANS